MTCGLCNTLSKEEVVSSRQNKIKSSEFISGYVFNSLERHFIKDCMLIDDKKCKSIDIPYEGYTNDIGIPTIWICGNTSINKDDVVIETKLKNILTRIKEAFDSTYSKQFNIFVECNEETNRYTTIIKWKITKREVKKMTVKEIEAALGYKVEIVSED